MRYTVLSRALGQSDVENVIMHVARLLGRQACESSRRILQEINQYRELMPLIYEN